MALKDIKAKIAATKRMHTVTRAMEAVSAAKMRKTQEQALQGRAYARASLAVLTRLAGTRHTKEHALGRPREGSRLALVVITSDRGLAGALNSSVLRRALEAVEGRDPREVSVFAYGRKGSEFFTRNGYNVVQALENKKDDLALDSMQDLVDDLIARYRAEEFDKVTVVYSNFRSTFEQIPTLRRLLPLSLPALSEIVEGIRPAKGRWANEVMMSAPEQYSVEPSDTDVLDVLIPKLISVALYHMLLEAKASEHSARMVAMKNASDKSKERTRDFTRLYNKLRQAAITREVSEIVGGREALAT